MITTTSTPSNHCLSCSEIIDAATGPGSPSPGDISVCAHCGHVTVFDDNLKLRAPTDAEVIDIAGNPELLAMQSARLAVKALLKGRT